MLDNLKRDDSIKRSVLEGELLTTCTGKCDRTIAMLSLPEEFM